MSRTKEADLVLAVLVYAIRSLAEGDLEALREMDFGPRELKALEEVELADLHRADTLRAHCLKITLNRDVFLPMLHRLHTLQKAERMKRMLLSADAPLDMMRRLFGMSQRSYSNWRRALVVEGATGRPPVPDEDKADRLWDAVQDRLADREKKVLTPGDFLELAEETGLGLRVIWRSVKRWEKWGRAESRRASKEKPPGGRKALSSTDYLAMRNA